MLDKRSVITVGNFDGVHRGHRALLDYAAAIAKGATGGAQVVVASFTRHPLSELRPEQSPTTLMDITQRQAALIDAGADQIDWLEPDPREVLSLSPRDFVEMMVRRHQPVAWVEGPNFRFGRKRAGDIPLLEELGSEFGFEVAIVDPVSVTLRDKTIVPVSSSLIRWLIEQGRMTDAQLALSHPYTLRGRVIQGEQRGRTIGFPTANLDLGDRQLPADGVYGGIAHINAKPYAAAISVGDKPTFRGSVRTFEVYILDFEGDLYHQTIDVDILRWIRDQAAFTGVDALVQQMDRDVQRIRTLYNAQQLSAADLAHASG
ncbi:riboflavin biosynthesis protein RibF [Planctomycetales bacterium ZRK34]|nr:riboflavin biosynthesis protein RibF [Planctomycetales bacterium ZRK34]